MKIGIVGLGVMGKNHLNVLQGFSEVTDIVLCDLQLLDTAYPSCGTVSELISDYRPDAVIVATPTQFHFDAASTLIRNGIPVLIEKPICETVQQAADLSALVSQHSARVAVGHVERFNPAVQVLKSQLRNQSVYSIHITRISPFPARIQDVGILMDLGVHDVDLLRFITGQQIVSSSIQKRQWRHQSHEDDVAIFLELSGKTHGTIISHWHSPFRQREIRVVTASNSFVVDLMQQSVMRYLPVEGGAQYTVQPLFVPKKESLREELAAFLNFVKTGELGDLAGCEDGAGVLKIITHFSVV